MIFGYEGMAHLSSPFSFLGSGPREKNIAYNRRESMDFFVLFFAF